MTKVKFISKQLLILLFSSAAFMACSNSESGSTKTDSDSFFSRTFGSGSSEDLNINPENISTGIESLANKNRLLNMKAVQDFYSARNNTPIWSRENFRSDFYSEIKSADEEGLFPEDYHLEEVNLLLEDTEGLAQNEQATLEILLTDAFFEYAGDLRDGKLNPKEMYKVWDIDRKTEDLSKLLQNGAEEGHLVNVLNDLKPKHEVYLELKRVLQEYEELKKREVPFTKIPKGGLIKPGDTDERIPVVAERLKQLELLDERYSAQGEKYDEPLQTAVREFQESRGLQIDRMLGNSTINQLNMSPTDRYNQILANLERWRWYPRDLGEHYILVNIPAFRLAVVKDGDTAETHNVIAGTKERQTPVFSDTLQYIVLNPEWHIPPTIREEDVIPKASKDHQYLKNNNISVLSPSGEIVDPKSINWSGDEVDRYSFVQTSGPTNPLGRVKIIYPNDHAIYLHDTPVKSLFERNERAESSGCVRVEGALDLAAYVAGQNTDRERINKIISSGKTIQIDTQSPILVHHFYWTAWRDNGRIVFVDDVYELDREIVIALQED